MRIFVGSSRESQRVMDELASVLEELGHEPLLWTDPDVFLPGTYTLPRLRELSRVVDAAIFVFGEDDQTWYRSQPILQPRDNVVLEYGLFAGVLGEHRALIGRVGSPHHPSDLNGLTYLDLSRPRDAKRRLLTWATSLGGITQEEVLVGRWLKIGPHGYHFIVEFKPDGTLIETPLFNRSAPSCAGTWRLDQGLLQMQVSQTEASGYVVWYRLSIYPSADGRIHRAMEVVDGRNDLPIREFKVLHVPLVVGT